MIPRYLILVTRCIDISSVTVSFEFCSIGLFGVWNNTKFVLAMQIVNQFALHQSNKPWKACDASLFNIFKFWLYISNEVSSANSWIVISSTALWISLIYNKKNSVPSTDPCVTPKSILFISDLAPLTKVYCSLGVRYDLKKLLAWPRIPCLFNFDNRISWSTLSKALVKSKKILMT